MKLEAKTIKIKRERERKNWQYDLGGVWRPQQRLDQHVERQNRRNFWRCELNCSCSQLPPLCSPLFSTTTFSSISSFKINLYLLKKSSMEVRDGIRLVWFVCSSHFCGFGFEGKMNWGNFQRKQNSAFEMREMLQIDELHGLQNPTRWETRRVFDFDA